MSGTTANDGWSFTGPEIFTEYGPAEEGRVERYKVRARHSASWEVFDASDWVLEVRFTPRIPPIPAGTLALVDGVVWRKGDNGRWYPSHALGFVLNPWTDRQIRAKGKPLTAGEWPSA